MTNRDSCHLCNRGSKELNLFCCNNKKCRESSPFCQSCLDRYPNHSTGKKGHETTPLWQQIQIDSILGPQIEIGTEEVLAMEDSTKWFRIVEDEDAVDPLLEDCRLFSTLSKDVNDRPDSQYPTLTTFIGESGVGKSTLINALMKVS